MTPSKQQKPISRRNHPRRVQADASLTWVQYEETDGSQDGFIGELPEELLEDAEGYADQFGLTWVHSDQGLAGRGGYEDVFDFGAGYYYQYRDWDNEIYRHVVLRRMPLGSLRLWIAGQGSLDPALEEVEGFFGDVFEGFEAADPVEALQGEVAATLFDYDHSYKAQIRVCEDGTAVIAVTVHDQLEYQRRVASLKEAQSLAYGQLQSYFGPPAVTEGYAHLWEEAELRNDAAR